MIWKTISLEDAYEVSNTGLVRNKTTKHIKSVRSSKSGHLRVTLYPSAKTYFIHRLVALAFVNNPAPEIKTTVNHINGNKLDNSPENLEWCTLAENTKHAHETGLIKLNNSGLNNPSAKFTSYDIQRMQRLKRSGKTTTEISIKLGFPYERVRRFLNGDSYKRNRR